MAYTCDDYIAWTEQFFPMFKFSRSGTTEEHFYPVDPEGWITHRANAPQTDQRPHDRGTAIQAWRHGTTELEDNQWKGLPPEVGPGQITLDAGGSGIGNDKFTRRPVDYMDWFLNFGGWNNFVSQDHGQVGYAWRNYQGKVHENLGLPSDLPPETFPSNGDPQIASRLDADATGLHAYSEFRRCQEVLDEVKAVELNPELAWLEAGVAATDDDVSDQIAQMIGITYYLFYPGYVPHPERFMEGQWEAVTVFLEDKGEGAVSLAYASGTRGWRTGLYPQPAAACRSASDLEKPLGEHIAVYVAHGSHANYFAPISDPINTTDPLAGADVQNAILLTALGFYLFGLGLVAVGAFLTKFVVGIVLIVVGLIIIALALLVIVVLAIVGMSGAAPNDPEDRPFDSDPRGRNDEHAGNGPNLGGPQVHTATPGGPAAPPVTGFINHPVSADPEVDDPDKQCPEPIWWGYTGRWGVCVDKAMAMAPAELPGWSNGCWRRWPEPNSHYTLAHRNVEALLDYLTEGPDPSGTAHAPNEA